MDLRRLQYFLVLAEEKHFGRAAARLHMAQPAISNALRRLENEVGARLFDRSSRRVELTDAGRALVVGARRLLAEAERTRSDVQSAHRGEAGTLVIGCLAAGLYSVLSLVLPAFRAQYPGINVIVREMPTSEQVIALRAGALDVGLLRPPTEDPYVEALTLLSDPYVVALPSRHPLAKSGEVGLAELAREEFVYYPRSMAAGPFDRMVAACQQAGFSPDLVHEAGRPESAVGLVACGLGVALVSSTFVDDIRSPRVAYRPLRDNPLQGMIAAAWTSNSGALAESFLTCCRDRFLGDKEPPASEPAATFAP